MEEHNPFAIAQKQFDKCAEILELDASVRKVLRVPMREYQVSLPVRMDDGTIEVFQGFRVQYNDARGPTKGGVRFHPNETIDTVRALSAWMTWKCALLDLPLGGAKGSVVCSPRDMSMRELEALSRAYVRALYPVLGPDRDIPAPDVYTGPQTMAWMMDEYLQISGRTNFGVMTGKPLPLGGCLGRDDATARGAMYTVREAAKALGIDLAKSSFAIQGFGNVGFHAAWLAHKLLDGRVVAVSDSRGAIHNEEGLDPDAVYEHKITTGSVVGFPGAVAITNDDLLELEVDVLVPAALESVITEENAPDVKARLIAEIANGPVTPEADDILGEKGVHQVPDFLCNAGGVTVSYFEMVQNASMDFWEVEQVYDRLEKRMTAAYRSVRETAADYQVNMRQAAYVVAVRRVLDAMRLRGWV